MAKFLERATSTQQEPVTGSFSSEVMREIERLAQLGVPMTNRFFLVATRNDGETQKKVKPHLDDVKATIEKESRGGKRKVLYAPGSYDVIHAGHASFTYQVLEMVSASLGIKPKDLKVLLLANTDPFIALEKASKWKGRGGSEPERRPIQSKERFSDLVSHPRLLTLASIPAVDYAGYLPSPLEAEHLAKKSLTGKRKILEGQKDPEKLKQALEEFIATNDVSEVDESALRQAIDDYALLLDSIQKNGLKEVQQSFKNQYDGHADSMGAVRWTTPSWQLLLHCYLTSNLPHGTMIRPVSVHDSKYKTQVDFLMDQAGIKTVTVHDQEVVSTTALLGDPNITVDDLVSTMREPLEK